MKYITDDHPPLVFDITPGTEACNIFNTVHTRFLKELTTLANSDNDTISSLAKYTKDLFTNQHAELGIGEVLSLTMSIMTYSYKAVPMIVAPANWLDKLVTDSFYQIGGIIFISSQIVDTYNGKLSDPKIVKRAMSFEAEYIKAYKTDSDTLNTYQQDLVLKFPNGMDSSLLYNRKQILLVN